MASSQKRKISKMEDSDDDEPSLGRQVLPVANLPNDFNGEPVDGLQYLFMVRRDARTLPFVAYVDNPYELKAEPIDVDAIPQRRVSLPSEQWREIFIRRFRNFRKNSTQPTIHIHSQQSGKTTPDMKNRDAWWAFVSGRPEAEWNPPKKLKQSKNSRYTSEPRYGGGLRGFSETGDDIRSSYDDAAERVVSDTSLPTPSCTPAPEMSEAQCSTQSEKAQPVFSTREPTPTLLQHIDNRYAVHLLMYFAHWINLHLEEPDRPAHQINDTHARWIFVLLSRVDDHITADEMSTLRSLARACMALIRHSQLQERSADTGASDTPLRGLPWWMVITAIAGLWGQRDLWSDAEALLAEP